MSITTKFGDKGQTKLCAGGVTSKSEIRMQATGDVDALVTMLGIAKSKIASWQFIGEIEKIQRKLFLIGAEVACSIENKHKLKLIIELEDLQSLEVDMNILENLIDEPKDFILPGKNEISALLDMSRVYCRALERTIVAMTELKLLDNEHLLSYINRLSDSIYLMARWFEHNNYNYVKGKQ